jgi:AcrR family transcriptional regulator
MVQAETQGKKERILAAAEEVFSKRGYTQSTLDEIIKIADTGKVVCNPSIGQLNI